MPYLSVVSDVILNNGLDECVPVYYLGWIAMKPLAYTSPYAWFFGAVFVFAYLPEFSVVARARPSPGENTDRGSTSLIVLAGWIGMTAAFRGCRNSRL